jgi:adenine-specific DNA-methyltransferase
VAKRKKTLTESAQIEDYRHEQATRKNNPPANIAAEGIVPVSPRARYEYNPHLPPLLRFDQRGGPDRLPELLEKAAREPLGLNEVKLLAETIGRHEPWLEWAGKRVS